MNTMILAPIVLCVLGIVFGAILAVAAKVFAVEKDPREEAIAECLPRRQLRRLRATLAAAVMPLPSWPVRPR